MPTLDALKAKYRPLFELAQRRGITVANAHLQDEKLYFKGAAPNEAIKVEAWTCIKAIDPVYADILCDLAIDPSLKVPETIYEVQSGDNLSKIAKHFYGDANKYMRIFEANKDQLADPDKIKVGQKLRIPN